MPEQFVDTTVRVTDDAQAVFAAKFPQGGLRAISEAVPIRRSPSPCNQVGLESGIVQSQRLQQSSVVVVPIAVVHRKFALLKYLGIESGLGGLLSGGQFGACRPDAPRHERLQGSVIVCQNDGATDVEEDCFQGHGTMVNRNAPIPEGTVKESPRAHPVSADGQLR